MSNINPFLSSGKETEEFNPFRYKADINPRSPIGGLRMTSDSRFLQGLTTDSNPNDVKAANQGFWSELGNSLVNFGGEVVLGAVEGAGYLNPLQLITTAFDSEKQFGNVISEWAAKKNEELQQDMFPVYNNTETADVSEWFFENFSSIGSAISLMIPAMAGTKALGATARAMRGHKLLKAIGVAEGSPVFNTATAGLETITMAGMSRHAENMMEATETYNTILEEAKQKGFSDDLAKQAAKEAAKSVYNKNWTLIMNDLVQFGMINKGWSTYSRKGKELALSNANKSTAKSILTQMGIEGAEEGYQFITAEEQAREVAQKYGIREKDYLSYPERLAKYATDENFLTSVFFGALGGGVFEVAGTAINNKFAKQQQIANELRDTEYQKQLAVFEGDKKKFLKIEQEESYRFIFELLEQGRADHAESLFQMMVDTKPADDISQEEAKEINAKGQWGLEQLKGFESYFNTVRKNNTGETMRFLLANKAGRNIKRASLDLRQQEVNKELGRLTEDFKLTSDLTKVLELSKDIESLEALKPEDLGIDKEIKDNLLKEKKDSYALFLETVKTNQSLTEDQVKEKLNQVDTSLLTQNTFLKSVEELQLAQLNKDATLASNPAKIQDKVNTLREETQNKELLTLTKKINKNTTEEELVQLKEAAKIINKDKEFKEALAVKVKEIQATASKIDEVNLEASLKTRWTDNSLLKAKEVQEITNLAILNGGIPENTVVDEKYIAERYNSDPVFKTKLNNYFKQSNSVVSVTKIDLKKEPTNSDGVDVNIKTKETTTQQNTVGYPTNPWKTASLEFKYENGSFTETENGLVLNTSSLSQKINWGALNRGEIPVGSTLYYEYDFNDSFNKGTIKGFEKIDANNAQIEIVYYKDNNKTETNRVILGAVPIWTETKNFGSKDNSNNLKAFKEKLWSEVLNTTNKIGRITLTPTTKLKSYESGPIHNLRQDSKPLEQNPLDIIGNNKLVLAIGRQKTNGQAYLDFGDVNHPYVNKVTAQKNVEKGAVYMMIPDKSGNILPIKIFNKTLNTFPDLLAEVRSMALSFKEITDATQRREAVDRISDIVSISDLYYSPNTQSYNLVLTDNKTKTIKTFTEENAAEVLGQLRVQIDVNKINRTVNGEAYNSTVSKNGYIVTDLHPDYFHSTRVIVEPYIPEVVKDAPISEAKTTVEHSNIAGLNEKFSLNDVDFGITSIDLGDIGKFKEATDEDNYTPLNEGEIRDWFEKNLPQVPVEIIPHLIEIKKNGGYAWGMFKDAAIILYNAAPNKIAYHEAFHAVFNLFLSPKEREAILNEASIRYGIPRSFDSVDTIARYNAVDFQLKSVNILSSDKAIEWFKKRDKGQWKGEQFWQKLQQDLQIPKEQIELLKSLSVENPYNREEILTSLLANYSYTVEINTAFGPEAQKQLDDGGEGFISNGVTYIVEQGYNRPEYLKIINGEPVSITIEEFEQAKKDSIVKEPTNIYGKGGINLVASRNNPREAEMYRSEDGWVYQELKINTPLITPSIKAHASFADDNTIGWIRLYYNTITKVVEIQEIQSDLFQKGRDKKSLALQELLDVDFSSDTPKEIYSGEQENQFLQLLNKDNNWVTFFIKSIIQDSAKKGYEKVLFPSGNTASKVEGHTTLEEFKKQKEDRIKVLEQEFFDYTIEQDTDGRFYVVNNVGEKGVSYSKRERAEEFIDKIKKDRVKTREEINQLKQELERVEKEGFGALKPIYNFYENTVANILKKQGYNPVLITDEYGNTWQEITLTEQQKQEIIRLSSLDKSVYNTNDLKLEEKLADEFMEYVQEDGANADSLSYNIRQFFRKLWTAIKSVFNKVDIDTLMYRINTGYYKDKQLPVKNTSPKYKVIEDPIVARKRVAMINYQFFKALDNYRAKNPNFEGLSDTKLIEKIGKNDYKLGLITVYGSILNGLRQAEFKLPNTDPRKAKLQNLINQFFVENQDKEISDVDGYFGKALADLRRYGLKYTPEGETNEQVLEDINNTSFEELYEEENFDTIHDKSRLTENPKDNFSYDVRKFLRKLEKYSIVNGEFVKGTSETNDDLGFTSFANYDEIVNFLFNNLADVNTTNEMIAKLQELQYKRPELRDVVVKALADEQFKTKLFVAFNKAYTPFLKVIRNIKELEFGNEISMRVFNANRKNIKQLIIDEWNTNLKNSAGNNITKNGEIDTVKAKQYFDEYQKIVEAIRKSRNITQEQANQLSTLLENFGITISPKVFINEFIERPTYYSTEGLTAVENLYNFIGGPRSLTTILTSITASINPYEGDTAESSSLISVSTTVASNSLQLHLDSVINIEGEQVYSYALPTFLSNLITDLKKNNNRKQLLENWWFKSNAFLNDLDKEENYELRENFSLAILNGINLFDTNKGTAFSKMTEKDLAISDIALFNSGKFAYYRVPILSDSPTSPTIRFKKYTKQEIVDNLYQVALAEKERIEKVDTYKELGIKHWETRGKEYQFLTIFNDPNIDINNIKAAKEAITNWLNEEFKIELDRLTTLEVIKGDQTSFFVTSNGNLVDNLKDYFYNKVHANVNIIQLTSIDLSFYKDSITFQKRNGQIYKLTDRLDTTAVWKDGTGVGQYYKSIYLKDVKEDTELFKNVNVTDAQSFIRLNRYKNIMIGIGKWTDQHESTYQKAQKGAWSTGFSNFLPSSIKPFAFTHENIDGTDIIIPVQHKNSQALLTPAMAKENPVLKKLLDYMDANNIDEIQFADSAVKVGEYGAVTVEEFLKGAKPVIHILNNKDYGIQQRVPAKHLDIEVLLGTQFKKLALSEIPDNIEIMGMNKQELFKTYQKLLTDNIIESYNTLSGEFQTIESVQKLLLEQVRDRGLSESYAEALKIVIDQEGNKIFNIPLFDPIHGRRTQNILNAVIRNNVTKQKIAGASLTLVSSWGLDKKLKIVKNKEGGVEYMEVMLPAYTRKFFELKDKKGEVDIEQLQKESPEVLELIGYRIPTEGWYSIKKMKIVGFTPDIMGSVALLPYDITTIAGEDFDIDKIYTILPTLEEVNWKLRKVKYNLDKPETLSKVQRDNALLDIINSIYSHPDMSSKVLTPGGFDTLKTLHNEIRDSYGALIRQDNIILPRTESKYFDINSNGGNLIGLAANHNSSHALTQYSKLGLTQSISFDGERRSSLHTTETTEQGRSVGQNLAEFLGAFVDTAKDPVATGLNLNLFTFDSVALIIRAGFSLKTAMYFINQSILKNLVNQYNNQNKSEAKVDKIVTDLRQQLTKIIGDYPKSKMYDLSTKELGKSFVSLANIPDPTAKRKAALLQAKVLETFLELRKTGKQLSALIKASKADTNGVGKTLAENTHFLESVGNVSKLKSLTGIDSVLNIPLIDISIEYGVKKPQEEILSRYFPYNGKLFKTLVNVLENNKGQELTADEINYVFNNFIHFYISDFSFFDETKKLYYINEYPAKFVALKKKYPELELIKYLAVKSKSSFNNLQRIEFTSAATISNEQIERLQDAWESMLGSDNVEIKGMANDLLNYAFFTTYLGFKYTGFSHLTPINFLENLRNKEDVSYRDFVYRLQNEKDSTHLIANYLDQIYRHKSTYNTLLQTLKKEDVTVTKKNKGGFVTSMKFDEAKSRSLGIYDEEGKVIRNRFLYENSNGITYTFKYSGTTKNNETVFNIQENLGYENHIVEFDKLNPAETNIPSNKIKSINADSYFDIDYDYTTLYSLENSQQNVKKADENLNNILKTFASSLGIKVEAHENLKSRLGIDAAGAADIYNKLILISQNKENVNTLPEEIGHFAEAFTRGTSFHDSLMGLVQNTAEYKEVVNEYGEIYAGDITTLKRETIGKLIGKAIVKRYNETRKNTNNVVLQFLEALWNRFIGIFRKVDIADFNKEVNSITEYIAEQILAGNTNIFTNRNIKIGEVFYKLSSEKDINDNIETLKLGIDSIFKKLSLYERKAGSTYLQREKDIFDKLIKDLNKEKYELGLLRYLANARIELDTVAKRYNQIGEIIKNGIPETLEEKRELINTLRSAQNYVLGFESTLEKLATDKPFTNNSINVKASDTYVTTQALKNNYLKLGKTLLADIFKSFSSNPKLKQDMEKALEVLEKDISFTQRGLDALAESGDPILKIIDIIVKDSLNNYRVPLLEKAKSIVDMQQELEKAGIKSTNWMYERDFAGNLSGRMISKWNVAEYNKAKSAFFKSIGPKPEDAFKQREWNRKVAEWFSINTQVNPNYKEVLENKKKEFITRYGQRIGIREYNAWVAKNSTEIYNPESGERELRYIKELAVPSDKYLSRQFAEIENNPALKAYYDKYTNLLKEVESQLPEAYKLFGYMPQVRKDFFERLAFVDKNGERTLKSPKDYLNEGKETILEAFKKQAGDDIEFGLTKLTDEKGNPVNFVPMFYTRPIDPTQLSTDASSSLIALVNSAYNYQAISKVVDMVELSKDILIEREILTGTFDPITYFKKEGEKGKQITIKGENSKAFARYQDYMEMVIYGNEKKDEKFAKLADTLNKYTSLSSLALNVYAGVANLAYGNIMTRMEAFAGELITNKDLLEADKIYLSELPSTLKDIGARNVSNKLSLWSEYHNTLQDYNRELRDANTGRTNWFSRMFTQSSLYFMNRSGEHYMQLKSSLALAQRIKVKDTEGNIMTLWEAYDVVNVGTEENPSYRLKLKEGLTKVGGEKATDLFKKEENGKPLTQKDVNRFINRQNFLNKRLHGIYNDIDKAAVHRYAIGRMGLLFRKWMKPGWNRRFEKLTYNEEGEIYTEGYYTTLWRVLKRSILELTELKDTLGTTDETIKAVEKANLIRVATEFSFMLATAAIASLATAYADDEDNWVAAFIAYEALRIHSELQFYSNPQEAIRLARSPLPAIRQIEKLQRLIEVWNWNDEMEKGKYKGLKNYEIIGIELVPFAGTYYNARTPEEQLKFFSNNPPVLVSLTNTIIE
jgi:hypothetical protein